MLISLTPSEWQHLEEKLDRARLEMYEWFEDQATSFFIAEGIAYLSGLVAAG